MNNERTDATTAAEPDTPSSVEPAERLAVGAKTAAAMFGVGERTWWRWDDSGKTPRPFALGGRKLWRVSDLRLWATFGFPVRAEFTERCSTAVVAVGSGS